MRLVKKLTCWLHGHDYYVGLNRDGKAVNCCRRCRKHEQIKDWTQEELKRWARGR